MKRRIFSWEACALNSGEWLEGQKKTRAVERTGFGDGLNWAYFWPR